MTALISLKKLTPIQSLVIGFGTLILLGAILLSLPVSSAGNTATPFLDALFTATSAVTTTGLVTVDTGTHFNFFGQIVIMVLFQVGGLGYMLFFVIVLLLFRNKLSMHDTLLLKESLKGSGRLDIIKFTKMILLFTFTVEFAGTLALSGFFMAYYPPLDAIYSALFHSISAFNTAGFSIYSDSLSKFNDSVIMNLIVIAIFTLGSLGFFVVLDSYSFIKKKREGTYPAQLSIHSKLVYIFTLSFFVIGAAVIYFSEPFDGVQFKGKLLNSIFQSLTASSTTGFNTIDIGVMSKTSLFLMLLMMFVGAGSGSTAGGIKITTFSVLILSVYATLIQKNDVNIFRRRIRSDVVSGAFAIFVIAALWTFLSTLILLMSEKMDFLPLLFEQVSALGTVGLSMGITSKLSPLGKVIIIISMFIGRIGPLGLGLSMFKRKSEKYQYPTGDIFIG